MHPVSNSGVRRARGLGFYHMMTLPAGQSHAGMCSIAGPIKSRSVPRVQVTPSLHSDLSWPLICPHLYADASLRLRLFCSTSEYFSRQLPLRAWRICFSLVSCLQNSSQSKSILFPLSRLTHTLSPYEQLPWQVRVADVNIGYESIVNTQVSANCAGRLWAQCAFILGHQSTIWV